MTPAVLRVDVKLAYHPVGAGRAPFRIEVSFEVPPGITVLAGPSGAGKSSVLLCIAGIQEPDEGRITLGSEVWLDTRARTSVPVHLRRVAYVLQSLALFPHMTGAQNVAYGMPKGKTRHERRSASERMLELMRVGHLADRKPPTMSGGEAQRVALARAFAMKPSILLLDEPFSALDAEVKGELMSELSEWVERESLPAVLVTHDADDAKRLAHRTVEIQAGKLKGA